MMSLNGKRLRILSFSLMIVLCCLLVIYLRSNLLGQKFTLLKSAKLVPQEAWAIGYISPAHSNWSKLEKYGTPEAKQLISQNLQSWQQETQQNTPINFQKDIAPWLGGVTFVFLPSNPGANNVNILLLAGIKDKLKAIDFINKIQNEIGKKSNKSDYQGITITETSQAENIQFSSAVVGNYLALGANRQVIEQAIDTLKGKPSYSQKAGVRDLLQQKISLQQPLVQFYIDDYEKLVQSTFQALPFDNLQQLEQFQTVAGGIGLENQGLHLKVVANLSPDANSQTFNFIKGNTISQLPSETIALISGQGLNKGWSEIVAQGQNNSELQSLIDQIRQGFREVNLDADREVFGWLDGEFSLGLVSFNKEGTANLSLGGMLVIETSDSQTGEQALNKLNQIDKFNSFIKVNRQKFRGVNLTEWLTPQEEVILSYGRIKEQQFIMTFGTSYETLKTQSSEPSLSQSKQYKAIKSGLPNKAWLSFYLDMERLMDSINQLPPSPSNSMSPETKAMLASIMGVGIVVTMPDTTTSELDVMMPLKSGD